MWKILRRKSKSPIHPPTYSFIHLFISQEASTAPDCGNAQASKGQGEPTGTKQKQETAQGPGQKSKQGTGRGKEGALFYLGQQVTMRFLEMMIDRSPVRSRALIKAGEGEEASEIVLRDPDIIWGSGK